MKLDAALLQSLARSKLLPRGARANTGLGERRSSSRGAGMEFTGVRAYAIGDDLRRIDPHLRARLGENFVRQYEVQRQLQVTILIDRSASMGVDAEREQYATSAAALLGFVCLAGGDILRFGSCAGGQVAISPRFEGLARAEQSFAWLQRVNQTGGSFRRSLVAHAATQGKGLTLIVSDFLDEIETELSRLAAGGQEIWCLHVESAEERNPALIGTGEFRFIDAETGEQIDLVLDEDAVAMYRIEHEAVRGAFRSRLGALGGTYVPISTGTPLTALVQSWRGLGLIA